MAQNKTKVEQIDSFLQKKQIDSATILVKEVLKEVVLYDDIKKAKNFFVLAKYYSIQNKEQKALEYLKKAETLFLVLEDKKSVADVLYEKYLLLKSQEKLNAKKEAKQYLRRFYEYAKNSNDAKRLIKAYMGFASLQISEANYKDALLEYDKAITICEQINDTFSQAQINSNKGVVISTFLKKSDSARVFYKKAITLFGLINDKESSFKGLMNLGNSYRKETKYKKALVHFYEADTIAIVSQKNNLRRNLYALMSNSYKNIRDYKNAHFYLTKYLAYKDSVDVKTQNIAILDIETKYQTEKKEKENIQLLADKKKQQLYMVIVAIVFLTSLIVGILGFINLRRKKEILKKEKEIEYQKVISLVKEQELKTMDAMLEGQEKERKRIAENLHDNLGGKLAVLALQFDNYIEIANRKGDVKQLELLQDSSVLLDDTYNTVRSMAHEEHANSYTNLNLVESVQALATSITNANKTEIQVIDFGLEEPINSAIEIAVFRIIQELITNIVKHANAKKATIDLTLFDNEFSIIISDDGKGYKVNKASVGLGLQTIKERVERLHGAFFVDSNVGKGTTIIIEIPLHKNL